MDLEKLRLTQMIAGELAVVENLRRMGLVPDNGESEANKISSNPLLAVSLPLEEMLNELPDNRPLYMDSGSWQIRSDNMEDVLYQQATNESLYNFIKRCYEKENKLMDLGQ